MLMQAFCVVYLKRPSSSSRYNKSAYRCSIVGMYFQDVHTGCKFTYINF